jgi:hypothetical protein
MAKSHLVNPHASMHQNHHFLLGETIIVAG